LIPQRSRSLARLFAVCGILLVPWIGLLIEQLHGQAGQRSFDFCLMRQATTEFPA
jgi:hypothetical protein